MILLPDLADAGIHAQDIHVDSIDEHILLLLQENGRLTNQELAARVGLTPAPCLRRVRKLEDDGIITGYSAIVDRTRLGKGFEVIIHADLVAKNLATTQAFEDRIAAMPEVAELRRMFGIPDYFIRVRVADLAAYEQWLTVQLMGDKAIARVDSRITMKLIKTDAP